MLKYLQNPASYYEKYLKSKDLVPKERKKEKTKCQILIRVLFYFYVIISKIHAIITMKA